MEVHIRHCKNFAIVFGNGVIVTSFIIVELSNLHIL